MCRVPSHNSPANRKRGARGFTITELLVAVSLMSLIVLALYAMFNQVQKALRSNEAQIDSTERGRSVLELVSRELESARVGMQPSVTNFWVRVAPDSRSVQEDVLPASLGPAPVSAPRTNAFDHVFWLAKSDRAWRGMGYAVLQPTLTNTVERLGPGANGMGTLYRFETQEADREYNFPTTNLFAQFLGLLPGETAPQAQWPSVTNFSQVASGIVHFKVLPYDTAGNLMSYGTTNLDSNYRMVRAAVNGTAIPYPASNIEGTLLPLANVTLRQTFSGNQTETIAAFRSNALPAYLELELGILEPDTMRQYNQFLKDEQPAMAKRYLDRRLAKVQIFRKRIPLRTVAQ